MPKRIRVIKKKVKEPDEFISTSGLIIRYVRSNYRNVIRIVVVVLIISFITYGWFYSKREKEKEASHLFYQTEQLYKRGKGNQTAKERYQVALGKFENIVKKYKGTSSALRALFYLGDCYYRLRDYDKAIDYYEQFINKSSKDDFLRCFAYEGLGYCYEEKGEYEQALKHFKKSMEETDGNNIKELEYLNLARNYEALSDNASALQFYKKVIDNQGDSLFSELAQDKVAALEN